MVADEGTAKGSESFLGMVGVSGVFAEVDGSCSDSLKSTLLSVMEPVLVLLSSESEQSFVELHKSVPSLECRSGCGFCFLSRPHFFRTGSRYSFKWSPNVHSELICACMMANNIGGCPKS